MGCSNAYTRYSSLLFFQMLGKLHCLMDNCIYWQQKEGYTEVGYNSYYDFKLASIQGLVKYSGTWADKNFSVHDQQNTGKEILK